ASYLALHSFPTRRSSDLSVPSIGALIFRNPITALVPRIMVGLLTGYLYQKFVQQYELKKQGPGLAILGSLSAVINTTLVLLITRSEEHTSELQSRFDLVC